jgi:hypothetical protein
MFCLDSPIGYEVPCGARNLRTDRIVGGSNVSPGNFTAQCDCCDVISLPCVPPTRRAGCVAVVRAAARYLLVLRSEYGRCFCQQHCVQRNVTQHANFLNFALGQRWEVGREAKCNVLCSPVAGTLHLKHIAVCTCVYIRVNVTTRGVTHWPNLHHSV